MVAFHEHPACPQHPLADSCAAGPWHSTVGAAMHGAGAGSVVQLCRWCDRAVQWVWGSCAGSAVQLCSECDRAVQGAGVQ